MTILSANMPRRLGAAGAAAVALALVAGLPAQAAGPDVPGRTPVAKPQAQTAVSAGKLRSGLARHMRRSGGVAGAYVGDPETGAALFSRGGNRVLQLASNMKIFTTAAALARLGPDHRFETALVAGGPLDGGVLRGDLILLGGGDPSLTRRGLGRLASLARAAGLSKVTGRVRFDETVFDRNRSVPQKGISGGRFAYLGRLSGLAFEGGRSRDPGRSAAAALISILRKKGVSVSRKTARGSAPRRPAPEAVLAEVSSSPLADLARSTNVFSINYYAEMLLKALPTAQGARGTTAGGAALARAFAREAGARLRAHNGSGLSRADRATPRSVAALLDGMLDEDADVREAFLGSLAVAGRSGTLARRMRGTAAQGRCFGKTGTLTGVSALSGYCEVEPGRHVVFSILMKRVDVGRAHVAQDRMTALIARYRP